jgi:IS30 family transposase
VATKAAASMATQEGRMQGGKYSNVPNPKNVKEGGDFSEFANHQYIADKLDAKFFFAHPYSSWERGLNEYTNGLIRQYIPKGTDFELYSNDFIRLIQNKLNTRPREKLNFFTPSKFFYASLSQD